MSSIDPDRELSRIFDQVLVPLARASAGSFPGPSAGEPSYYCEPLRASLSRADFESSRLENLHDMVTALETLWQDQPELAAVAAQLGQLAEALSEVEPGDDLSPFLYAMF